MRDCGPESCGLWTGALSPVAPQKLGGVGTQMHQPVGMNRGSLSLDCEPSLTTESFEDFFPLGLRGEPGGFHILSNHYL